MRRIGEVAKLFADSGVILIASFISPYRRDRNRARQVHIEANLGFIEIFVDTPIAVCEKRDPKGLYRKARIGKLNNFTGVDDPYEPPINPELLLNTVENSPQGIAVQIIHYLSKAGYINHKSECYYSEVSTSVFQVNNG